MTSAGAQSYAAGLPDRAAFTLLHCGVPMRFRGSVKQLRGQLGEESETTSCRFTCDGCGSTLELHLTERA